LSGAANLLNKSHLAMLLTFATFGCIVGTHVGSLPVLVKQAGVSPWAFGLAGSLGMATNILCMSVGGYINRFASHRTMLLAMLPVSALALLYALMVTSVAAFIISFLLLSAVLGVIDLFMNAEASVVEEERQVASFNTYHGTVMLAIAVCALLGSIVSVKLAPWWGVLFVVVPLVLAWIAVYRHAPSRASHEHGSGGTALPMPVGLIALIGLAAGFNVTCEVAAIQWSGQLLAATAPELAAISGLGLAFYGLCAGTMRLFGDRVTTRFGELRIMSTGLLVAIAGFFVLGIEPGFWTSTFAFAAVGLGLAVVFPSLFSLVGRLAPGNRAGAMSLASLVSGLPRVALPWSLGMIAAAENVNAVFGALAFVAAGALLLIFVVYRRSAAQLLAK
jgi:MFS family permease